MYTYTTYQPASSPWIPAHTTQVQGDLRTPLTHNNTQQHTRTPNNRQQHTITVHSSTRVHKITNVPLFKKLWDIIFFCGTITLWAISRDILRGPRLFWPLKLSHKKNYVPQFLKQRDINSYFSSTVTTYRVQLCSHLLMKHYIELKLCILLWPHTRQPTRTYGHYKLIWR